MNKGDTIFINKAGHISNRNNFPSFFYLYLSGTKIGGTQYRIRCLIDNCRKTYLKSTKKSRMLVHKKATFKCSKCDMMFKCPIVRKRHEAIHDDVRYKCEKCEKRFIRENSLKVH